MKTEKLVVGLLLLFLVQLAACERSEMDQISPKLDSARFDRDSIGLDSLAGRADSLSLLDSLGQGISVDSLRIIKADSIHIAVDTIRSKPDTAYTRLDSSALRKLRQP